MKAFFSLLLIILFFSSFTLFVSSAKLRKSTRQPSRNYTFALVPKQIGANQFFDHVRDGCLARAEEIEGVTCIYIGPDTQQEDAIAQAEIIEQLINSGEIDGISFSVIDTEVATDVIAQSIAAGIPIVTFDSDAPDSERLATIGTDNYAFGVELAKILVQLNPEGGHYGMISADAPNVVLREVGVRDNLVNTKWVESEESPKNCLDDPFIAVEQMFEFAADPKIKAIVPVGGWPMFVEDRWWEFAKTYVENITLVVGDSLPVQVKAINQGLVDGLVGQLPFQMGQISVDTLLAIQEGEEVDQEIFGTNLIEMLRFPLVLPELNVDMNYLDELVIVGYVFFSLIAAFAVGFVLWTIICQSIFVIRAAQPIFLVLIALGTLIIASTLFPLSIDDENHDQSQTDAACMAIPWTLSIGFTLTFSALFSKTWRVNRVFKKTGFFRVVKVTVGDVLVPMIVLLLLNSIVLICWTAISPLVYKRREHDGTDDWNRIISTYGSCDTSDGTKGWVPYVVLLLLINFSSLIFALVQVYKARGLSVAFSETRYIGFTFVLMLQAFVVGIPLLFLVYDQPRDYYVVWLCLILVTCIAILFLIFIPKVRSRHKKLSDFPSTSGGTTGGTLATEN